MDISSLNNQNSSHDSERAILNTEQVLVILMNDSGAEFSLQPVKVVMEGGGQLVAGYHIYEGQLPRMIHVKGNEIWNMVAHPGPDARE
jgi:hypothetical protein